MIKSYELVIKSNKKINYTPYNMGHWFYAELLSKYECSFSDYIHTLEVSPINQYIYTEGENLIWHINALGDMAVYETDKFLFSLKDIYIKNIDVDFAVLGMRTKSINDIMSLIDQSDENKKLSRIHFKTPAAYKQNGEYINMPSIEYSLKGLINKWNRLFPETQIEDEDGEGVKTIIQGIKICDFNIYSTHFRFKQAIIPSFIGEITIKNNLKGVHKQLGDALIEFSEYAGIGIKTSLGMGGVKVRR